ncbi:MAG: hypothetical protein ACRDSP_26940 [Pseudonocardiaceae bacterium]
MGLGDGVKDVSTTGVAPSGDRKATATGVQRGRTIVWTVAPASEPAARGEGCPLMADLAYALVFIGIFLVLALTLRGLERL